MASLFWILLLFLVMTLSQITSLTRPWVFSFIWAMGSGGFVYQNLKYSLTESALVALIGFLIGGILISKTDDFRKRRR